MAVWADAQRHTHDDIMCPLCRSPWTGACKLSLQPASEPDVEVHLPVVPLVCFDTMRFARPWAQAFGERLVSCLLSPDWSVREIGLRKLQLHFNGIESATLVPALAMLERACADPVFKIYETALLVVASLRSLPDSSLITPVVERILTKCGDVNGPTKYETLAFYFLLLFGICFLCYLKLGS
jgi:hypothetical protein